MRVDAKVPGALKGNYVAALALSLVALGAGACGKRGGKPAAQPAAFTDAVRPAFLADALRKLGGGHYHATLRYAVGRAGATPLAITTTTDVWLDHSGNYRMREENDQDGGREVVLTGRELAVALRYGRMIRRVAEEPEPSRLLEQGLGAPWAAFELCAPRAKIAKTGAAAAGRPATAYALALGGEETPAAKTKPSLPLVGLRGWRGSVAIDKLTGSGIVDDATGALLAIDLASEFEAKGDSGPEQGTVEVHAALTEVGATPPIERPPADELVLRQRTVPEARELLHGLAEPDRHGPRPPEPERHGPRAPQRRGPGALKEGRP
jgi:hypothetical protein